MAAIDEPKDTFELPADDPRKRANFLSVLFFRYRLAAKYTDRGPKRLTGRVTSTKVVGLTLKKWT